MDQYLGREGSSLGEYLQILRRRKRILILAVVLVPMAAVLVSLVQERLYEASAQVLLSYDNPSASLTGLPDSNTNLQTDRIAQTQADLARVPAVVERTLTSAGLEERSVDGFLRRSQVSTKANSDLLEFRVTDSSPTVAVRLATEYARQYTLYRKERELASISEVRKALNARIAALETAGDQSSAIHTSLVERDEQLKILETVQSSNASLVRPATEASKVQPRPVRNGLLGLALGIALGIGLVLLLNSVDTRLRSGSEVGEVLGLPLLARLPEPPKRLRATSQLAMLAEPQGADAEAIRILQANLELVIHEREARVIVVTSALGGEGKSTTVANLAVAFARAGRRTILVDLDLRRPSLDGFFTIKLRPGVIDVALGWADLDDALATIATSDNPSAKASTGFRRANGGGYGVLQVLGSGPVPTNPGEFMRSTALGEILEGLRERADIVLIDSSPLLGVGDTVALSARVDGLIVVTRLKLVRGPTLSELGRVLLASPADKIGFVLTGAQLDESEVYGSYGSYYDGSHGTSQEPATASVGVDDAEPVGVDERAEKFA